jgi:hypothetical protein
LLGRRNAQVVVKLLKTNRGQERRNSGAGRARLATCTEAMDRSDSWHDEAAPPTDNWLKNNIDPLIKSPALANSVFIIVFDESLDVDVVNGGVFVSILPVSLIRDESQPPGISQSFLLIAYIVAAWDFCKGAAPDARLHLRMKFARGAQLPISGLSAVLLVHCRRQCTSAERFRKHKTE